MTNEQGEKIVIGLALLFLGFLAGNLMWLTHSMITESAAITACEFNTERVIKCEYIRTAMPITPEQRNK